MLAEASGLTRMRPDESPMSLGRLPFPMECTVVSGVDGEVGAVGSVGSGVLVGKAELSYTYTMPVREGRPYDLFHGILEARTITPSTSKLIRHG